MDISCTNQSSLVSIRPSGINSLATLRVTRFIFPNHSDAQLDQSVWLIEFQHCNLAQTQGQLASKCVCVNTEPQLDF